MATQRTTGRNGNKETPFPSRHDFEEMGLNIMRRSSGSRAGGKTRMRRFISWFGAEPVHVSITWKKLCNSGWLQYVGSRQPKPLHLLWTFMWLKSYHNEEVGAGIAGVDEKTYREKVWFYLKGIARMDGDVVSWIVLLYQADKKWCLIRSPSPSCFINYRSSGRIVSWVTPDSEPLCQ